MKKKSRQSKQKAASRKPRVDSRLVSLRERVLEANLELWRRGLAPFTFGNASGVDRELGMIVIKGSGIRYDDMTVDDLVSVDLAGQVVDGHRRPSSDLLTHMVLYHNFDGIGGIAHSHAHYATVWAQAAREIPCLGTTHADYFHGPVPLVAHLDPDEVAINYESNTGQAIVRRFETIDHEHVPACIVAGHGPFSWGATVTEALETMSVLEEVARLALDTVLLNATVEPIPTELRDKHFFRKHGPGAYYGQK